MNSSAMKIILLLAALAVMAATAFGTLAWKKNQRLGRPGIQGTPLKDTVKMAIELPEKVLNFQSTNITQPQIVVDTLPQDTSFAQRIYTAPDGFAASASIVLMGADRTSIHKPEFCLPGQGWNVLEKTNFTVTIAAQPPYQMTVAKWVLSQQVQTKDGKMVDARALYLFWFVADNEQTISHWQRLWWLTRDLLQTGVLQRWAYVSYFTVCLPGQEDAAFARMKELIAASVPGFQLAPVPAK